MTALLLVEFRTAKPSRVACLVGSGATNINRISVIVLLFNLESVNSCRGSYGAPVRRVNRISIARRMRGALRTTMMIILEI